MPDKTVCVVYLIYEIKRPDVSQKTTGRKAKYE